MRMWRRFRELDRRPAAEPYSEVAEEAEAYLSGRLLPRLVIRAEVPAPWVWLNSVARCTPEELVSIADRPHGQREHDWAWARAELARQVMRCTGGRPDLVAELQREVLFPLELALGDDEICPGELVEIASIELELLGY